MMTEMQQGSVISRDLPFAAAGPLTASSLIDVAEGSFKMGKNWRSEARCPAIGSQNI
jgi:hypothetical protein